MKAIRIMAVVVIIESGLALHSTRAQQRRTTRDTDAPGNNVAATISRFRDSGHDRYRRRCLFVPITEFVDTSSHHSAFDERSVVHPLALQKGGPCRRETWQAWLGR